MKDIKTYKKVFTSERGSKDLVFYSEGWENSNVYGFAFFFFGHWECFSICCTEHLVMR